MVAVGYEFLRGRADETLRWLMPSITLVVHASFVYLPYVDVSFTRHARNRMRLYKIAEADVQAALAQPEHVTEGEFDARHAWRQTAAERWLRVTFAVEATRTVVITVTPKRRFPGAGDEH